MSAYKAKEEEKTVTKGLGTFTQMEYRGSDAGDNTYYQWGRKDPMLGGIYSDGKTPTYWFYGKGSSSSVKTQEFNMENKQVFNQYRNEDIPSSIRICSSPTRVSTRRLAKQILMCSSITEITGINRILTIKLLI